MTQQWYIQANLILNQKQVADLLVIGWNLQEYHRNYIFGSNLDPNIKEAPCDATLVNF